jgi:hypothetical protein
LKSQTNKETKKDKIKTEPEIIEKHDNCTTLEVGELIGKGPCSIILFLLVNYDVNYSVGS